MVAHHGTEPDNHLLPLYTRPYGKDVPRLDYWLAYETIMKKFGGRPHWAKVNIQTFPLHPKPTTVCLVSTRGRAPPVTLRNPSLLTC